jgi:hypothetical protein
MVIGAALLGTALNSTALTLDAVKARIRTIGTAVAGGWNLFSNGEVGDYIFFPAATDYQARVHAWGSPCQGIWPEMALLLDGEHVGQITVGDRQAKDYEFRLSVTAGAHTLAVAFLNDAMVGGEDRNLYLERSMSAAECLFRQPVAQERLLAEQIPPVDRPHGVSSGRKTIQCHSIKWRMKRTMAVTMMMILGVAEVPADRMIDLTPQWEHGPSPMLKGFHNLYNPCVVHEPTSEYPFKMWFFGWPVADVDPRFTGDAIFFARARTLNAWEVYAGDAGWERGMNAKAYVPVMTATPKPYDGMANGDPSVVLRDGVYYMALSSVGFDARKDPQGRGHLYNVSCILGATSKDGIHWTKTHAPILIWDQEFSQPWEIVDGKIPPAPKDYYGAYHRPSLMFDEGRWKLWFDYFLPGTFVSMGYAENEGDFTQPKDWKVCHAGHDSVLKDWPNPSVVKYKNTYIAFSDAPNYPPPKGGDGRLLTMATSPDGITWKVQGHIRPDGMESSHVPQALLLSQKNIPWLYVFYAWKPQTIPNTPWDFRYKELRYIRCRADVLLGKLVGTNQQPKRPAPAITP